MLQVDRLPHLLADPGRPVAPHPVADRLVPRLGIVQPDRQHERQRRADHQVLVVAVQLLDEPVRLGVVHHRPRTRPEQPATAAVQHHEAGPPVVPCVAELAAAGLQVGLFGELVQQCAGVTVCPAYRGEQLVGRALAGRHVAEVLVDPVRADGAAHPLRPPGQLGHLVPPGLRGVPVVPQVVVVDDHGRGQRGEQPAHLGVGPRDPVQLGELGEVAQLVLRRVVRATVLVHEVQHGVRRLVRVDLVPEQDQRGRPVRLGGVAELVREAAQHVEPVGEVVFHVVRHTRAAGTEHQAHRRLRVDGPDPARWQVAVRLRPHLLAAGTHGVLPGAAGLQVGQLDDPEMVPVQGECR